VGLSIITRSSQCFVPFGISFLYSEIFFPFLHFSFEMLLFLFVCNYCFQKVVGMRSCTRPRRESGTWRRAWVVTVGVV
jgi:hypothetical protein